MSSPAPFDPTKTLTFSASSSASSARVGESSSDSSASSAGSSSSSSSAAGAIASSFAVTAESPGDSKSKADSKAEKELSGADVKGKSEKDKILPSVDEICTHLKNDPKAILQQAVKYFIHVEEEGVSFAPRHGVQLMERALFLAKPLNDKHTELLSMLYLARIYSSGSFDIMLDKERAKKLMEDLGELLPSFGPVGPEIELQLALYFHDGLSGCYQPDLKARDNWLDAYKESTGIDCSIIFKIMDPEKLQTAPLKEFTEYQIAELTKLAKHQVCANFLLLLNELNYKRLTQKEKNDKIRNYNVLIDKLYRQGIFQQIPISAADFFYMYPGAKPDPLVLQNSLKLEMMSLRKRINILYKLFVTLRTSGRFKNSDYEESIYPWILKAYNLLNATQPKYIDDHLTLNILGNYASDLFWGVGCAQDYKKAREIIETMAKKNDTWGKIYLAYFKENGIGGPKIHDPGHLTLYHETIRNHNKLFGSEAHWFAGNYHRLLGDYHSMMGHLAHESFNSKQNAYELISFYLSETEGLRVYPKTDALHMAEFWIKRTYNEKCIFNSTLLRLIKAFEQISGKKLALPAPEASLPCLPSQGQGAQSAPLSISSGSASSSSSSSSSSSQMDTDPSNRKRPRDEGEQEQPGLPAKRQKL